MGTDANVAVKECEFMIKDIQEQAKKGNDLSKQVETKLNSLIDINQRTANESLDELQLKIECIWEELKLPELAKAIRQQEHIRDLCLDADERLAAVPVGASVEATELWKRLHPLNMEFVFEFYARVSPNEPKPDLSRVDLYEGGVNEDIESFCMKHDVTCELHGVMRYINEEGSIFEQTYKFG